MQRGPLYEIHKREALTTTGYHGWELPAVYSTLEQEFQVASTSAALVDLSCYGRLEVTGTDRIDLLHRLSTNDLLNAVAGDARKTLFVTDKGRMVDSVIISVSGGDTLAIHSPEMENELIEWIGKYTITEDIRFKSLTSSTSMISIVGPKAFSAYGSIFSTSIQANEILEVHDVPHGHQAVGVIQNGLEIVHMVVANSQSIAFWEHLAEGGTLSAPQRIGTLSFEALRIAYGIPAVRGEISDLFNPFEVGLGDAISFSKGCYIGQEVIARLNTYRKVQKTLVGLEFKDTPPLLSDPAELHLDGKAVGFVTSILPEEFHGRFIGLGVVRLDVASLDTTLKLNKNRRVLTTKIINLPIIV